VTDQASSEQDVINQIARLLEDRLEANPLIARDMAEEIYALTRLVNS